MWAIVPLKPPSLAKSRLAEVLTAEQRRAWFFDLAQRAIEALRATRGIERVAVITPDPEVSRFAHAHGAVVLPEAEAAGTARAFASALAQLPAVERVLMMAGDLPLVCPRALGAVVEASARHEVVIVPDRLRHGTNALACSPPDAIAPCFGEDSYARHLAAARDAHRSVCTLALDALALDIDVPADIELLRRHRGDFVAGLPLPAEAPAPRRAAA